ncbi:3'(2'),5'-bisphosphate nucleotidase CysQ [Natronosporangium hydrolyticum]|uniref:3'(2'),5-bisphosphonucleoside 3'(2')-phosphohydrolase n=1 Tax=Natronosporangium hydrolyticum TaxID=2811111 RepID=A0A895YNE1_9ACTN|nr:3'(2'),5'-bisphosphate nucleotidase CysQ [Natronosporangium hydrolyticum]QSB15448.1 3'(2'),5'-bisphosphate nucleotidase CysQ [Natronosporangium hydrolyticum]
MTPPVGDGAFARWLAARAGDELLALRAEFGHDDPARLRDAGDKRAHDVLVSALSQWRAGDAVLSEEGVDDPRRLTAERVWIVDPLDGTREFSEPGRVDWAVHVALWSRNVGLQAGAVALPAQHRLFSTDHPPAYPPLADPVVEGGRPRLRIAVSRTRPPAFVAAIAEELGGELVPLGSAGAKIAAVIAGEVDAYLHAGGQYEWDSAAPVAVARATGLHTSRIDGSTLEYNQPDPRLPDLLVCRRDLAGELLAAVARRAEET